MIIDLNNYPEEFKLLKNKYNCEFNGVIHIGAHYGEEYKTYKDLSIYPIVFIEALPHIYNTLITSVGPECICINTALGNIEGTIKMHVETANGGASSSVLKPKLHLHQHPQIQFHTEVEVSITKLDLLNIPSCNFLVIDVQGYELEVLKGASNYLKNVDYIIVEVNRDEVYENCVHINELDSYLNNYGFIRVETEWSGYLSGDAFYIKTNKN